MADDIRRWSDELARDPSSMVFLPLADALRRRGQLQLALKVATRGLERHRADADAHDLVARICADRGDVERALVEWDAALQLVPHHAGALKGMGFACFHSGRAADAQRYLEAASKADPDDPTITAALARVRAPGDNAATAEPLRSGGTEQGRVMENGRGIDPDGAQAGRAMPGTGVSRHGFGAATTSTGRLFGDVLGDGEHAALLLDAHGLVLAGSYRVADGRDVAQDVGGALTGVSDEARRAMRHLGLGEWSALVFEAEAATVAMMPLRGDGGIALVASARSVPLGLVRRLLTRIAERGAEWLATAAGGGGPS